MTDVRNIVLVHGGFVDGAGWRGVYDLLTADGFNVSVVQNQTLSLESDVETTDNVLDLQDGPAILVGHSYGGAVITEAGNHDRVAGLVYIAAFAPDQGESVNTLIADPPPGMDTDVERVAALAEDHGIMFVNCPVIGTRETAKRGRLVVLASGPGDALDRAQPIFDALGSKTVRLEPEAGRGSRIKLVANAWTVGLWESLRAQLSRTARRASSRRSADSDRHR